MLATVEELLQASKTALRSGDVGVIAQLYHPNAALYSPGQELIVGRAAIADHFRTALAQIPEGIDHEATDEALHLVTPDVAIVDSVGETFRVGPDGAREVISIEGFTMIAVRSEAEGWLWAGIRGALVPK